MKILISTGIYPPEIGGPAQYAFNLEREFGKMGHGVRVAKFSDVRRLPSFFRHLAYFFKILPSMMWCDWCLALDTFSVALPTVAAANLFGKKIIIRTGGDFLWENYVERTGDLVLLRNFYQTARDKWITKERAIFKLTKWTLMHATKTVFSTAWQRDIWREPYSLDLVKTAVVENYYGPKNEGTTPERKNFVWAGRRVKLKNLEVLPKSIILETGELPHDALMEKIKSCYAVILPSLSDISPNLVLEALTFGKPVISTKETGIRDRLGEAVIWIDPQNPDDTAKRITWLLEPQNYQGQVEKVRRFSFTHNWSEIANEFHEIASNW